MDPAALPTGAAIEGGAPPGLGPSMRWMKCAFRNPRPQGFTLVEVLISVTILAVGILSIGQIFAIASRNAAFGRTETVAVSLAREISEKILSESVEQVKSMFDGVDTADPGSVTEPCLVWAEHLADQLGPTGRGRIWVRDAAADPELLAGMFSVLVEVSFVNRGDSIRVPVRFAVTSIGS